MAKLSINLLPPEFEAAKKQKNKFSNTLKFSIIFLVVVIGVAAVVLSLRLSQNIVLSNVNKDLEKAKTTLNSPEYKQREGLVVTLRNRLESIGGLLSQETYGSYAFSLISDMAPIDVSINSFAVDDKGIIKISTQTNNIASLETFFNRLISPDTNQKKIIAVNIEGINRAKSDFYQTELSIYLLGAVLPVK